MPNHPPGFFLNPHNWAFLPQQAMLPAYPWTPSREVAQWIPGDDGYREPMPANTAQGLLDVANLGTPANGLLNIAPADPISGPYGAFSEENFRGAAPQYVPLNAPLASGSELGGASFWQGSLADPNGRPPVAQSSAPRTEAVLQSAPASQVRAARAFGPEHYRGVAPQSSWMSAPSPWTTARGGFGNDGYRVYAGDTGGEGQDQMHPSQAYQKARPEDARYVVERGVTTGNIDSSPTAAADFDTDFKDAVSGGDTTIGDENFGAYSRTGQDK